MFGLSTLEEAINFAGQMAKANLLPAHLKGSPADCLRVVMQAARWQMDPFAVADKTSVINGKLMHESQLVTAVINARGNLAKRLDYKFDGEGDKRVLTVTGTLKGESEPREITLDVALAKRVNKNGQMVINPDQQMCYIGARMWARRHMSELMMGVYTPDEIDPDTAPSGEPENVTPIPDRPAPVPRAKRGAAAAKEVVIEQEAEPVVSGTVAATTVVENIQAAMEAREAKVASVAPETPNPSPIPPTAVGPRVFLKDGEQINATIKLGAITPAFMISDGVRKACFRTPVTGDFCGEVRSAVGTLAKGQLNDKQQQTQMDVLPPFVAGATVSVVLVGKKSTAPAGHELFGKVLAWISDVKQTAEEESA